MSAAPARLPERDEDLIALACHEGLPDDRAGFFEADCPLRRISAAPPVIFGGGRALFLEIAHPLVAAGVAEHSNFRRDPFGRLSRTLAAMSDIVFGDRARALAAARNVERAHERVHGRLSEAAGPFSVGTPYHGRDPELARWVWATLVESAVVMVERFGAPLDADTLEAYYRDHRVVGRLLGVPDALIPPDWDAFRTFFDEMLTGDRLTVTRQAREIGAAVLDPPVPMPDIGRVRAITTALLTPRLREAFGLPWDADRAERFERFVASVRALAAPGRLDGARASR